MSCSLSKCILLFVTGLALCSARVFDADDTRGDLKCGDFVHTSAASLTTSEFWTLYLINDENVTLSTCTASDFDSHLYLYDGVGNYLADNKDSNTCYKRPGASEIVRYLLGGPYAGRKYFVLINGSFTGTDNTYGLTVSCDPDKRLACGDTYSGEVSAESVFGPTFVLSFSIDTNLKVTTCYKRTNFATELQLSNSHGVLVSTANNTSCKSGQGASLGGSFTVGTYYISLGGFIFNKRGVGKYTIGIDCGYGIEETGTGRHESIARGIIIGAVLLVISVVGIGLVCLIKKKRQGAAHVMHVQMVPQVEATDY